MKGLFQQTTAIFFLEMSVKVIKEGYYKKRLATFFHSFLSCVFLCLRDSS